MNTNTTTTNSNIDIARNVRANRIDQGMTARELANRAGVCIETIERTENGRKTNLRTLEKIAEALGLDVTDLITQEPDEERRELAGVTIGQLIKNYMEYHKFSAAGFGYLCDLSKWQIYNFLEGYHGHTDPAVLCKLSHVLGIRASTLDYLEDLEITAEGLQNNWELLRMLPLMVEETTGTNGRTLLAYLRRLAREQEERERREGE